MEKLLTIEELSKILGIKKATIYSWTSKKRIPYIKLSNGILRFRESEIQEWILKKSVLPDLQSRTIEKYQSSKRQSVSQGKEYIERIIKSSKEAVLGLRRG